ncbi:MAG: hypothetical protein D6714_01175 [Bacteroidetes bacterium]|nr:MAG: hypothetical protein D6714_01175 [Bacteroidota bacterium]
MDFFKKRKPYFLILALCLLQFGYIYSGNSEGRPANFWVVVLSVTGALFFQIWRNNRVLHVLFTFLFICLTGYLALAFLSDLAKADAFDAGLLRFIISGILFFSVLAYIQVLLFKNKPGRFW